MREVAKRFGAIQGLSMLDAGTPRKIRPDKCICPQRNHRTLRPAALLPVLREQVALAQVLMLMLRELCQ